MTYFKDAFPRLSQGAGNKKHSLTLNNEETPIMAYSIIAADCTSCGACEDECPSGAISYNKKVYVINAAKCTECEGAFDEQQCAAVCPADCCVPA